jgi:hypothetical protein
VIEREGSVILDFSECYYIDQEGIRWLAAAKAAQKVTFSDRRSNQDRRALERRAAAGESRAFGKRQGQRRARPDRRRRSEF